MKKLFCFINVMLVFITFGNDKFTISHELAKGVVSGENKELNINGFPASNRICRITKGSAFEIVSNRFIRIGNPIREKSLYYLYFNNIEELTNTIGQCLSNINTEGLFQISNKVLYSHYTYDHSKHPIMRFRHSQEYTLKRGYIWEVRSFVSVIEQIKETLEIEKTKRMILEYSKLSGLAYKSKFKKIRAYYRTGCIAKLSNYYNFAFRDCNKTHYSIEIKIDDEIFYGYIEKDTHCGEEIFKILSDGKIHIMNFVISYPLKDNNNGDHVVIIYASKYKKDNIPNEEFLKFISKLQVLRIKSIKVQMEGISKFINNKRYSYKIKEFLEEYNFWKNEVESYYSELDSISN